MEPGQMGNPQKASPEKLAPLRKCAHPNCTCTVDEGEEYCSDYCLENMRADSTDKDEACGCGHAECTSKEAVAAIAPFTT